MVPVPGGSPGYAWLPGELRALVRILPFGVGGSYSGLSNCSCIDSVWGSEALWNPSYWTWDAEQVTLMQFRTNSFKESLAFKVNA